MWAPAGCPAGPRPSTKGVTRTKLVDAKEPLELLGRNTRHRTPPQLSCASVPRPRYPPDLSESVCVCTRQHQPPCGIVNRVQAFDRVITAPRTRANMVACRCPVAASPPPALLLLLPPRLLPAGPLLPAMAHAGAMGPLHLLLAALLAAHCAWSCSDLFLADPDVYPAVVGARNLDFPPMVKVLRHIACAALASSGSGTWRLCRAFCNLFTIFICASHVSAYSSFPCRRSSHISLPGAVDCRGLHHDLPFIRAKAPLPPPN